MTDGFAALPVDPARRPALGAIHGATLLCADLEAARAAYEATLGYRAVARATVDPALAARWGAPGHAGAPLLLLQPPAGDGPFLRFIESRDTRPHVPCSAWGWHALELAVTSCDAATDRLLAGGLFTLLDAPHDLGFSAGALRAAQLAGPFGEVLYLTEIRRPVPGYALPRARSPIDMLFIVVQHGPSARAGLGRYGAVFGNAASPVMQVDIAFMARLHGCEVSHRYGIGTLALGSTCFFELDDTPAHIGPRPTNEGLLPAGIALVSCRGALSGAAASLDGPFYAGVQRLGCTTGPGGERLEILD